MGHGCIFDLYACNITFEEWRRGSRSGGHIYKFPYFVNMSTPYFRYVAYLFREILRKTNNGPFAKHANRAVILLLFHGKKIGCHGGKRENFRLENEDWIKLTGSRAEDFRRINKRMNQSVCIS